MSEQTPEPDDVDEDFDEGAHGSSGSPPEEPDEDEGGQS